MPRRLRPSEAFAADAILTGDPGRAMMLAQELTSDPKMSNHARGLWGYTGIGPSGRALTVQSTGTGAPSAAIVLEDLFDLGVRRAIRIGTCQALDADLELGTLIVVESAAARDGVSRSLGVGDEVFPDPALLAELSDVGRVEKTASSDMHVSGTTERDGLLHPEGPVATDLQSAALMAIGQKLGVAVAVLLIVSEIASEERISDDALELAAKRAGHAALDVLST